MDINKIENEELYQDKWLGGTIFQTPEEHNDLVLLDNQKNKLPDRSLKLGELLLPVSAEPENVLIIGKPGSGKTQLLYQVIELISKYDLKAVVYDFKGDFVSKFYDKKNDLIFNPLDERSLQWNVISEIKYQSKSLIKRYAAIESICHSLIPNLGDSIGNDRFFRDGARSILKSLIIFLLEECEEKEHNNSGLLKLLSKTDKEILEMVKAVNPIAANFIMTPGSNQTAGVLAVLSQFTESLLCLDYPNGNFTVFNWVKDQKPGIIFVTGYPDIRDMIRPVLSLFIDTIAKNVLSLQDDLTNRIFFILEELPTLQRLNSVVELCTNARSKGGSIWPVSQDTSQIENIYGKLKNSIINACSTKIIFAVADNHDAKEFSDLIGEAEYLVQYRTDSGTTSSGKDGISDSDSKTSSYNRQIIRKSVILPSNIMNQEKFNFLARVHPFKWVRTKVNFKEYKNKCESLKLIDRPIKIKNNPVNPKVEEDKNLNMEEEINKY